MLWWILNGELRTWLLIFQDNMLIQSCFGLVWSWLRWFWDLFAIKFIIVALENRPIWLRTLCSSETSEEPVLTWVCWSLVPEVSSLTLKVKSPPVNTSDFEESEVNELKFFWNFWIFFNKNLRILLLERAWIARNSKNELRLHTFLHM